MIKKEKQKKEETYFIVLLKKKDLLFASWKIDSPKWKKRIETAEEDSADSSKDFLFIEVLSVENGNYKKIDSIPVHGLENSWHIFVKKDYYGKRIIFSLSYRDKKGKFYDILISQEIHIPYAIEDIENIQLDEEKILFEFSEIKSAGITGEETTSW